MNGHPGDEKKAAVVSGGARGIGRAIARRLLEDGYSVLIFDIDRKTGMKTVSELQSEGDAAFCHVDVGDEESVKAAFEQLPGRGYSHIDFVVNNAGIYEFAPLNEVSPEHSHRQFNLYVLGLLLAWPLAPALGACS